MYIHIHIYMCIYIYVYIYIYANLHPRCKIAFYTQHPTHPASQLTQPNCSRSAQAQLQLPPRPLPSPPHLDSKLKRRP